MLYRPLQLYRVQLGPKLTIPIITYAKEEMFSHLLVGLFAG